MCAGVVMLVGCASPASAQAPGVRLELGGGGSEAAYVKLLLLFASISLAPALLAVVTSFARIAVVLFFLRAGLGAQEIPPNMVIIGLAILLTIFTMAPTLEPIYQEAVLPLLEEESEIGEAARAAEGPLRVFMLRQVRPTDLALMAGLAAQPPTAPEETALSVLSAAFVISELRAAFIIGFIIYLPFVIIDLVVASTLASVGVLSLPAPLLALPFKVLLFVMVDGWQLLTQALVMSIGGQ